MLLRAVECQTFRCLTEVAFSPSPGVNIVRGGNAQGKTSLLEAILYAATSKSHRTSVDGDLAQHGQEGFSVTATAQRNAGEIRTEARWWRGAKRFKVNGVPQERVSEILGRINVVFFSPEDVELVKGTAAFRRRFLDMELSQIHPGYLAALQQYRQALKQRNELLRRGTSDGEMLDIWDVQLAQHGRDIVQSRAAFVATLSSHAAQAYAAIAGAESLKVAYVPNVREEEDLLAVLSRVRNSDRKRGVTQRGPHRDDIELRIQDKVARSFASQGQQKSAALALKLAEVELVRGRVGEYPILMLDEVLAELDAARSQRLAEAIGPQVQCILTTTDLSVSGGPFGGDAANFHISEGHLEAT